mmetsp:Transcript_3316/g.11646  ORF Transcript_3316/g.11646 Transcript_3316/m.11646 type:complete len:223 (-) Transcript_3316:4007-4675(-)
MRENCVKLDTSWPYWSRSSASNTDWPVKPSAKVPNEEMVMGEAAPPAPPPPPSNSTEKEVRCVASRWKASSSSSTSVQPSELHWSVPSSQNAQRGARPAVSPAAAAAAAALSLGREITIGCARPATATAPPSASVKERSETAVSRRAGAAARKGLLAYCATVWSTQPAPSAALRVAGRPKEETPAAPPVALSSVAPLRAGEFSRRTRRLRPGPSRSAGRVPQ